MSIPSNRPSILFAPQITARLAPHSLHLVLHVATSSLSSQATRLMTELTVLELEGQGGDAANTHAEFQRKLLDEISSARAQTLRGSQASLMEPKEMGAVLAQLSPCAAGLRCLTLEVSVRVGVGGGGGGGAIFP
jgi:hypothetical protein